MADEKKTVTKEEASFFSKVSNFFKALPKKIAKPFKNTWHELRKVTWPTKKEKLHPDRAGVHGVHGCHHRFAGLGVFRPDPVDHRAVKKQGHPVFPSARITWGVAF